MNILIGSLVLCQVIATSPSNDNVKEVIGRVDKIFTNEIFREEDNSLVKELEKTYIVNSLGENKIRRLQVGAKACRKIDNLSDRAEVEKVKDSLEKELEVSDVEEEILIEEIEYIPLTPQEVAEIKKQGLLDGENVQIVELENKSNKEDYVSDDKINKIVSEYTDKLNPDIQNENNKSENKEDEVIVDTEAKETNREDDSDISKNNPKDDQEVVEKVVDTEIDFSSFDNNVKEEEKIEKDTISNSKKKELSQDKLFEMMEEKKKELAKNEEEPKVLNERKEEQEIISEKKEYVKPTLLSKALEYIIKGD